MDRIEKERRLKDLYLSSPAALSTPKRLQAEARKVGIIISLHRLSRLMSNWLTYTKFKVKYKNPRLRDKVIVSGPNHLFQIDLCMLPKYRHYIGLLVCIDCFTRKLYARAIKSKTASEIAEKLSEIFKENGSPPNKLNSDAGKEFINQKFAKLMADNRIHHFVTQSHQKAQFAERAIGSIKKLLRRQMFQKSTRNWVGEYEKTIETLNKRVHSATGLPPDEISIDNAGEVFRRLYPMLSQNLQPGTGLKPRFKIGQTVRILLPSIVFQKGDLAKTTDEVYKIGRILFHPVLRYKLASTSDGSLIAGSFNESELIPASLPQEP